MMKITFPSLVFLLYNKAIFIYGEILMKRSWLILSLTSLLTLSAYADESDHQKTDKAYLDGLNIGVLASAGSAAYAIDDKVGVVPFASYDSDYFYIEGIEAGFYAYKDDENWFRTGINYERRNFKPDDAVMDSLKGLDERKSSANLVLSYMRITPIGGFEIKAGTDMMDRSGGQTASIAHRSRFVFADDTLTVYPKFGVNWYSQDYNQYYFGVSEAESAKTGLDVYEAKSSYAPFVSISGQYKLTDHVGIFTHAKAEWLSSTQKDSPLTDDDMDIGVNAGLTYNF